MPATSLRLKVQPFIAASSDSPYTTLESYGGGAGESAATNTTAFNSAISYLAGVGGGNIRLRRGTYQCNAIDSIGSDGIYIEGAGVGATTLKFLAGSTTSGNGALQWQGTAFGSALTLSSNGSAGAYQLVFSSVTGLAVGDYLFVENHLSSTINSGGVLISRIVGISGTTVSLFDAIPFAIATSDSYFIGEIDPIEGGGLSNLTVDGSAIVNGVGGSLVSAGYMKNAGFHDIAFTDFPGTNDTSFISFGCRSSAFSGIRALQTTGSNAPIIYATQHTACSFDGIVVEASSSSAIFSGFQMEASCYCQLGKITVSGSLERGVKFDGNYYCSVDSTIVSGNARDTLMNAVCLDSQIGCNYGQIIVDGTAIAGLWLPNQEGLSKYNLIGLVVAKNCPNDVLISTPTGSGVNPSGNVIDSIIADVVTIQATVGWTIKSINGALPNFAKASLPSAAVIGAMIYVTDETGGATPAFSDGTNWRRVADRAIVS